MEFKITNRYVFKTLYSLISFYLFPIYILLIITLNQKAYLPSIILGFSWIGIIIIVLLYTTIVLMKRKKFEYIIIDENELYIADINGDKIKLKSTLLELRNPILNIIFSPLLTSVYLCTLYDCYVQFEDTTYYGFDFSIADYLYIKKMKLKNVKFYKIRDYITFPII